MSAYSLLRATPQLSPHADALAQILDPQSPAVDALDRVVFADTLFFITIAAVACLFRGGY
jgi:hypothetical protein